jgi:ABC-2 type transport system permease protein
MDQENKNDMSFTSKLKASFSGRKFKSGVYVSLISAIVLVIVLVVNLFVSKINYQIDLSAQKLYTLTSDTENVIKGIKDDITIYYLVEAGQEYPEFQKVAQKYDSLSDHIKLESKDPVLYPNFASQYVQDKVTQNSFIVVNNTTGTAKYIDSSKMVIQETDYNTYQTTTTGVDVEGQLTNAIQYVTNPNLPIMYVIQGHGEAAIGDNFKGLMEKQNMKVQDLSTLTQSSIPKDCEILFINAPTSDFTDTETKMIKDYLAAGGKAMINVNYKAMDLPNLKSILDYYGVELVNGFIVETDSNMFIPNNPHYLVPKIESHDITQGAISDKLLVIAPISSGLKPSDTLRSSLKVEPLLTTSDKAYSKVNINTDTLSKEDGDIDGPFNVGLAVTDTFNNVTTKLVVYSSDTIFEDNIVKSYGNGDILTGTVKYLAGENASIAIPSKSVVPESLHLTQQQGALWGAVVVFIIPVLILVSGIFVSLRRRKR